MRTVTNVILHFVGLLTLRTKPQNLMYSMNTFALLFLLLVLAIKVTIHTLAPTTLEITTMLPLFIIFYDGLFLSILFLMLNKVGKKNRFVQAACNFLGVNIIGCLASSLISFLPLQLVFLCLIKSWLLMINFHITKHAFAIEFGRAVYTYLLMNTMALLAIILPFIILVPLPKITN